MNPIITVDHVQILFPHRKKRWAYKELQTLRDALKKRFVTLSELASYYDFDLADLRQKLAAAAV